MFFFNYLQLVKLDKWPSKSIRPPARCCYMPVDSYGHTLSPGNNSYTHLYILDSHSLCIMFYLPWNRYIFKAHNFVVAAEETTKDFRQRADQAGFFFSDSGPMQVLMQRKEKDRIIEKICDISEAGCSGCSWLCIFSHSQLISFPLSLPCLFSLQTHGNMYYILYNHYLFIIPMSTPSQGNAHIFLLLVQRKWHDRTPPEVSFSLILTNGLFSTFTQERGLSFLCTFVCTGMNALQHPPPSLHSLTFLKDILLL